MDLVVGGQVIPTHLVVLACSVKDTRADTDTIQTTIRAAVAVVPVVAAETRTQVGLETGNILVVSEVMVLHLT